MPLPRATARVVPTESYKECGAKWNPPVTASPCQSPLGKEAERTGVRIATAGVRTGFAMTRFFARGAMGGRPQGSPLRSFTRSSLRADRGILPYGGFPDRISQGLPTPFLHISCSLCVDSLWINFPSPFLPPSCGNSSFPLWTKNLCISRPYGGFQQKFSLRLLLLKNT